jgi:biopolymer transport protein ExbB
MKLTAAPARSRLTAFLFALLAVAFVVYLAAGPISAAHAEDAAKPAAASGGNAVGDFFEMIGHIIYSVGWFFGIVLLSVSICLVALIVLLAMDLRMTAAVPPGFVEEFTDTVNKRQFKQAYEMAKADGSYLGRVMTAGMARLQYGIEDAREAAFQMVESIKSGKESYVAYLATIGTLGPLLGLIGTVWGMIGAFKTLGAGAQFEVLAGHISQALVLTLLGIALSVPAIATHTFYRNRLIRIAMDTSTVADDLLTQMYHNSRKPASGASTPAAVNADDARAGAAVKAK